MFDINDYNSDLVIMYWRDPITNFYYVNVDVLMPANVRIEAVSAELPHGINTIKETLRNMGYTGEVYA